MGAARSNQSENPSQMKWWEEKIVAAPTTRCFSPTSEGDEGPTQSTAADEAQTGQRPQGWGRRSDTKGLQNCQGIREIRIGLVSSPQPYHKVLEVPGTITPLNEPGGDNETFGFIRA